MKKTEKQTALILGGTVPHAELTRLLRKRGYFTVLVDYFENPPAAAEADVHRRESAMDYESVLKIAKEYDAKLILSSCLDQQINIAMRAAEELGIPHPFSSETAEKVTNKTLMKKIMEENGIPTARYSICEGKGLPENLDLRFPVIVKPVDSCGSAGVRKIDITERENLGQAICEAGRFGLSGGVLVEEFITGTEMGVHGYIEDGKAKLLFGTCKITEPIRGITIQLCNMYLPKLKDTLQEKLERIMNQIVRAFDLPAYSPLFMQVIVRGNDVFVIEFSPRVAGGLSSEVSRIYSDFDLISYSIDSYLGVKKKQDGKKLDMVVCNLPLYANDGVFDHVTGPEKLKEAGIVHHEILLKTKGDHIDWSKPSSANVMKYVIDGVDFEDCYRKLKIADENTAIIDRDGRSMRNQSSPLTYELLMERLKVLI